MDTSKQVQGFNGEKQDLRGKGVEGITEICREHRELVREKVS